MPVSLKKRGRKPMLDEDGNPVYKKRGRPFKTSNLEDNQEEITMLFDPAIEYQNQIVQDIEMINIGEEPLDSN